MNLKDARITVVGLGLMGGSIARGLQGHCQAAGGVDQDPKTLELARRLGVCDKVSDDLYAGLEWCDLAILAVPVRAILDILARIGEDLPIPGYVLDLGSTKAEIMRAMSALPHGCDPIGGHPICGKEASGLASSDPTIFQGATFVLTPLRRTSPSLQDLAQELIRSLGARPKVIDAERHDRLLATSSHLPYLLASALIRCGDRLAAHDDRFWDMAGPGFRDTSRLAGSDVRMMVDILLTNKDHVAHSLGMSLEFIEDFLKLLQNDDLQALYEQLHLVQRRRAALNARDIRQ